MLEYLQKKLLHCYLLVFMGISNNNVFKTIFFYKVLKINDSSNSYYFPEMENRIFFCGVRLACSIFFSVWFLSLVVKGKDLVFFLAYLLQTQTCEIII